MGKYYSAYLVFMSILLLFFVACEPKLENGFERIIMIEGLDCGNAVVTGSLMAGTAAKGVSVSIPFSRTNGGEFPKYLINASGVNGLVATLEAGNLRPGSGFLVFIISGTPTTKGSANFEVSFARAKCTFQLNVAPPIGVISSLNCANASHNGSLVARVQSNDVISVVPYTGGNGGIYTAQSVNSTGVTGLTATLSAGTLASGSGNLSYTISGTPSGPGIASFALNIAGQSCTLIRPVVLPVGTIGSLACSNATNAGNLIVGVAANGITSIVPYSGGNGGTHNGQTVNSTGVTGLTATLASGIFEMGSGSLVYSITGTPSGSGIASFTLNIGGQQCSLTRTVNLPVGTISTLNCSGASNSGNLIAGSSVTGVSSTVPYTGGNGGTHTGQTVNSTGVAGLTATLSSGTFTNGSGSLGYSITGVPSGPGTASFVLNIGGQQCILNRIVSLPVGMIAILNCAGASNFGNLIAGNTASGVTSSVPYSGGNGGTYGGQTINSTGVTGLTATLAGGNFTNGAGILVYSITGIPSGPGTASFSFNIGGRGCTLNRSVATPPGAINSLNCSSASNTGSLFSGNPANGVSSTVPYTGGNGGIYAGQTVNSTGVIGLTATLVGGIFANGASSLLYSITGTPSNSGTASFSLNIGGRSCTLTRTVIPSVIPATFMMKSLNAGTFSMGCTSGDIACYSSERPVRNVTLSPFQIGITEITQAEYQSIMGNNPSYFIGCNNCPVEQVSWYDAIVFCNRLSESQGLQPSYYSDAAFTQVYGKSGNSWNLPNAGNIFWNQAAKGFRLPTEAEWEYAARGGSRTDFYPGGFILDNYAWFSANSGSRTRPVKGKEWNGSGLYDIGGNVWEWCWDWHGAYPATSQANPIGASSGSRKVLRGGSWNVAARDCRVSSRSDNNPSLRLYNAGFRVVR
jgi:formylglycine-generating enzyme required for sulfatase activity